MYFNVEIEQHLTDEPYKVYFENLYREDGSFFGLVDSISGITTNMRLIISFQQLFQLYSVKIVSKWV